MSEVTDLVLPVLRSIQVELTALRAKIDDFGTEQVRQSERLDRIEHLMTYHMGITMQHSSVIEDLQGAIGSAARLSPNA